MYGKVAEEFKVHTIFSYDPSAISRALTLSSEWITAQIYSSAINILLFKSYQTIYEFYTV